MSQEQVRLDTIFQSDIIHLPQIKIASNHLFHETPAVLHETALTSPFDRVNQVVLTFMIKGSLRATHGGMDSTLLLTDQTCSFVYAPRENYHAMAGNQIFDSIALGVDKGFLSSLSQEDHWMDSIRDKMENNIPFSATGQSYKISPAAHRVLLEIRHTAYQGSLRGLYQQSKVCELLMLQIDQIRQIQHGGNMPQMRSADHQKLYDLHSYLKQHYLDDLSLDLLARVSGLNTFKIKTGFKALFGQTVFEYLRHLRMEYAAQLLSKENHTVSEVADILGYEYVQHFSTAFKKHFGASPNNYL